MLFKRHYSYQRSDTLPYSLVITSTVPKKGWWIVHGLNFFLLAQIVVVTLAMSSPKTLASLPAWPWLNHTVTKLNASVTPDNPAIVAESVNQATGANPVQPFLRAPAPTPAPVKATAPRATQYISASARQSLRFNMIMPLAFNGITQGFGGGHTGIDLRASTGTPINAAAPGKVIEALTSGYNGGWGKTILVDDGNGMTTRYAHLSELLVSKGDTVTPGQIIAKSGATGRVTGPHLHFEVRINNVPTDPLQ